MDDSNLTPPVQPAAEPVAPVVIKKRRHPLDKEYFLEGNRQKWVGIGLVMILIILFFNVVKHIDPSPYLQGIMLLIGAGVLGWSVDSAVKAYTVGSTTTNANNFTGEYKKDIVQSTTVTRNVNDTENKNVIEDEPKTEVHKTRGKSTK